jgi:hypothetical protein
MAATSKRGDAWRRQKSGISWRRRLPTAAGSGGGQRQHRVVTAPAIDNSSVSRPHRRSRAASGNKSASNRKKKKKLVSTSCSTTCWREKRNLDRAKGGRDARRLAASPSATYTRVSQTWKRQHRVVGVGISNRVGVAKRKWRGIDEHGGGVK